MNTLPAHRQIVSGRTFSSTFGPDYFIAVERLKRRANWWDRIGWVASAVLLSAVFCMIRWPALWGLLGSLAKP